MTDLRSIPPHLLALAAAETLQKALGRVSPVRSHPTTSEGENGAQRGNSAADRVEPREGEYRCEIVPIGKPRQTQSDKWKERGPVVRYRTFADALRKWADGVEFRLPDSGCHMRFEMPMPRTWSEKKKAAMDGQPHQQRCDCDNLIKATQDALRPDDCRVWQVSAEKRWARSGAVVFRVVA